MKLPSLENRNRFGNRPALAMIVIFALMTTLFGQTAQAQLLYGQWPGDDLFLLDLNTGTSSLFYDSVPGGVNGVAVDDAGQRIFTLGRTGEITSIGYDLTVTTIRESVNIHQSGLAYDPGSDSLFYTNYRRNFSEPTRLYQFDLAAGQSTLLGELDGGLPRRVGGLSFNPADGILYGLDDVQQQFVAIDLDNLTTDPLWSYPGSESDIDGLAIGDGIAYLVLDQNDPFGVQMFDLENGDFLGSLTTDYPGIGDLAGAGWAPGLTAIPEPGSAAVMGGVLLGWIARRRRRPVR